MRTTSRQKELDTILMRYDENERKVMHGVVWLVDSV